MAYSWQQWLAARKRGAYVALSTLTMIAVGVGVYIGADSYVPGHRPSSGATTLLWLYAPRDMGRLPSRTDWCTGADHCWVAQETAGATQLADVTGGWTLDASGTPRAGVFTGLPVEDATGWVDFTSELSTHTDGQSASGTGSWYKLAQVQPATNLVSVSAIIMPVYRQAENRILYSHRATADSTGFSVGLDTAGKFFMTVENSAGTTKTVLSAAAWDDGAWRCVTWVLDGRSANAGKIYIGTDEVQAASPDLETTGSWATTGPARVGADAAGSNVWPGGIARLQVKVGTIDPATSCGTLWQAVKPNAWNKLASAADSAWTQTGGARCFPSSANTALCTPGGKASPEWFSGVGQTWGITANRTNRVTRSTSICAAAGWTLVGTATGTCNASVSPAGAKTGSDITVGTIATNVARITVTGFVNDAVLYPGGWVKCSSGTLRFYGGAGRGEWTIDCATVANRWIQMTPTHPAVTVVTAWTANATGGLTVYFGAPAGTVSVSLWGITLTEVDGDSVIPTRTAAVSTGTVAWTIDNNPAVYYVGTKGKITAVGNWISGQCLDIAPAVGNVGRFYGDGTDWIQYTGDATPTIDSTANLTWSGVDSQVLRWDSTAAVSGGVYALYTRDGVAATWDATPTSAWTSASPALINLDGYGSTSCRAGWQTLKIEDRP